MPSILKVGLLSKDGPYACFESEVGPELMADDERLANEIRRLQFISRDCVLGERAELARIANVDLAARTRERREPGDDRPEPAHAAAGRNGVDRSTSRNGPPPAARREDRGRDRDGGGGRSNDRPPATGKALVAFAKTFDEQQGRPWLMRALSAWAKRQNLPAMFNEWTADEVADGYRQAQDQIENSGS
jgi:hypothetical protein